MRKSIKRQVKSLGVKEFDKMLDECMFSDEEKEIATLIYKKDNDLGFIADKLGYSERTITRKHARIKQIILNYIGG